MCVSQPTTLILGSLGYQRRKINSIVVAAIIVYQKAALDVRFRCQEIKNSWTGWPKLIRIFRSVRVEIAIKVEANSQNSAVGLIGLNQPPSPPSFWGRVSPDRFPKTAFYYDLLTWGRGLKWRSSEKRGEAAGVGSNAPPSPLGL